MEQNYRQSNPLAHYAILLFIVAIGALTLVSHTVLHAFSSPDHHQVPATTHKEDHCHGDALRSHTIAFRKDGVEPKQLTIARCDAIVIGNELDMEMIPAIGSHSAHMHYAGFEENTLEPGHTYSFRATTAGTYSLHNHENATQAMRLTVQ